MRTIQQLFDLKGKTALVTGGSRGLGLQIAEALGEQGATLVLSSRKQSDLDEAVAHLKSRGIEASAIAADVSKESAIGPLVQEAMKRLGHIDILVNNAGATWGAPAEDHPAEAWDKVMNLNIRSIFLLSQAVGKLSMIPRKYGRIINVASIAGLSGNGPDSMQTIAYNTSKGAVVNFTRYLAAYWGKKGVRVNTLSPGGVENSQDEFFVKQYSAKTPLGRMAQPTDYQGAIVFLASDASAYMTGANLVVDGGWTAI